jgi:hypothetical protein
MTSKYNTGYMTGDIRGAWNVDTDVTALSGTELITNGTFTSNITGWTDSSGSGSSISWDSTGGGRLAFTGAAAYARATQSIITVVGNHYTIAFDVKVAGHSSANASLRIGTSFGGNEVANLNAGDTSTGIKSFTFKATTTATHLQLVTGYNALRVDDFSCRLAIPDRSVKGNGLAVHGTPTVSAVATGAELKAISGFSSSNYLEQPSNSDLDFGSGSYSVMGWFKRPSGGSSSSALCIEDNPGNGQPLVFLYSLSGAWRWYTGTGTGSGGESFIDNTTTPNNTWVFLAFVRTTTGRSVYANGVLENSDSTVHNFTHTTNTVCTLGNRGYQGAYSSPFSTGSIALPRISATAPTAEQIKEIYEAEKPMFQENAKCTLNGSSDAVTALAYDDSTELLHVGTSGGRSTFQGLRRVDETSTSTTEIAAQGGLIVEET